MSAKVPFRTVRLKSFRRVHRAELAEFADFLSVMLDEGVSLADAVGQCRALFAGRTVGCLAARIAQGLSEGRSLSQALQSDLHTVDTLFVRSVAVGERSGNMAAAMRSTSAHLRQQERLRRRVLSSLAYPCTVLFFLLISLLLFLWLLFPRLEELSRGGNQAPRSSLTSLAERVRLESACGLSIVALGAAAAAVFARRSGRGVVRRLSCRLLLSVPHLGTTIRLGQFALFLSGLETLVAAGESLEEALSDAAPLLSNPVLSSSLWRACEKINGGEAISAALSKERWIPNRIAQAVSIAEQTGKTEELLGPLCCAYEWEYRHRLERLAKLAEPALLSAAGVGLAVVVTTVFLPLLNEIAAATW